MPSTFVEDFCKKLIEIHGTQNLRDVEIVIPSQRIGLHIRKSLASLLNEPAWLPQIKTVDHFLSSLHGLVAVDELELTFQLYKCYVEVFDQPESFDSFLGWSNQILSDFNDIDKYLLDSKNVFFNLKAIKEIESWSFNASEISDTQKSFLIFWEKLGELHERLNTELEKIGKCTKGFIYKTIANNPIEYLATLPKSIYFIGFNALSTSEEKIFKFLVNSGNAKMVWDADSYYVNNVKQEAGMFVRRFLKWSKSEHFPISNALKEIEKTISIYPANSNLGQTVVASELLRQKKGDPIETALVFGDESLLKPMLNVLPENIDKVNVAMGYPLASSNCFSLFDQLIDTIKSVARYKSASYIYHKDFVGIFGHELLNELLQDWGIESSKIFKKISKQNYAYIPKELVKEFLGEKYQYFNFLFHSAESNIDSLLQTVIELFEKINDLYANSSNIVEQEAIRSLLESLRVVLDFQSRNRIVEKVESMALISKKLLRNASVSFYGEPLNGLQMLGLLETRGLDFKEVILMSCNEGVLPSVSYAQTIMPADLRKYLGLPTKEEKEAMFAYYFYRLIQRAEKVHLIYNGGAPDGISTNEMSRYILQLKEELSSLNLKDYSVTGGDGSIEIDSFLGLRDTDVFKTRLKELFEKGLSASSLNNFRNCPRDFYFNQLLRMQEADQVEEDIEHSTYGTIVHNVLEDLYLRAGEIITKDSVEQMMSSYLSLLNQEFDKVFPDKNYLKGKNLLEYERAKYTLQRFFEFEKDFIEKNGVIKILGLERHYEKVWSVNSSIGEINLKLKGNIDRIDKVGNTVRIIDYKTGTVKELNIKEDISKVDDKTFQLLMYLYLYCTDQTENIQAGMISFKKLNEGLISLTEGLRKDKREVNKVSSELLNSFKDYVEQLVEEIAKSDFKHNESSKYCTIC